MASRLRRVALGALVFVVAAAIPGLAAAQTSTTTVTTAAPTSPPTTPVTTPATTPATTLAPASTAPAATTAPATVRRATTTVRRAATTARRATTTAKAAETTAAATTTAAPTTVATTAASTIPPTTIALVTTPSVAAVSANDASSTRTVNGVIVGLFVLAGLVALLTIWFYRHTAPLPASLEVLEFMGRRSWRKRPEPERTAQLAALRTEIGAVPPENVVNLHPVPVQRPVWRPTEVPDDSVADALVGLVPAPSPEVNGTPVDPDAVEPVAVAPADHTGAVDPPPDLPAAGSETLVAPVPPVVPPGPDSAAPAPTPSPAPPVQVPGTETGGRPASTLDPHG